jgi:hypothetical protein
MVVTLKDELDKYLSFEDEGTLTILGQAIVIFDKATEESTDISDLDGEWWEKLPRPVKCSMIAGFAMGRMVNAQQVINKYLTAGEHP